MVPYLASAPQHGKDMQLSVKARPMRDHHVRRALHRTALRRYHVDPTTLVLDELGLCRGAARVDVAVVNGRLEGYEIKAAADTLRRLPAQAICLNAVFDRVTLVVADRHLHAALHAVPSWWGMLLVEEDQCGEVHFDTVRRGRHNPAIDPVAMAELLWRDELIEALAEAGESGKILRQPRTVLCRRVADLLGEADTRALVTRQLKGRQGWRDRERRAQRGD
jgi:hypothetical protein